MRLGCSGAIVLIFLLLCIISNPVLAITMALVFALAMIIYIVIKNHGEVEQARYNSAQNIDASMSKETSFQFNSMVYKPVTSSKDDIPNMEMILRTDPVNYVKSDELSKREQDMLDSGYSMENIKVARINVVQGYNAQYQLFDRYYQILKVESDITTVPNRAMTVLLKQMVMCFYHEELGLDINVQPHSFDEKMIKKFIELCPEVNMSASYFDNANITNERFLNQRIDKGCLNAFKNIMVGYDL